MASVLLFIFKFFGFNAFSTFTTVFLVAETIGVPIFYFLSLSTYKNGNVKGVTVVTLLSHLFLILLKMVILIIFFKTGFSITTIFGLFLVLGILDIVILSLFGAFSLLFLILAILNVLSFVIIFFII